MPISAKHSEVRTLIRVTALVDWNTQVHGLEARVQDPVQLADQALQRTARAISRLLREESPAERYQVTLRLYHGWRKGFKPAPNLKAVRNAIAKVDFAALSQYPSIVFLPEVCYGDLLLEALPDRLHTRQAIHLPNTLRQQRRNSRPSEKMVDTALAADLLVLARQSPSDWILVLGDDDDLVPPVFVAEAWLKPWGGRILLVRSREGPFLRLSGLIRKGLA
jgi:hypothetical protein